MAKNEVRESPQRCKPQYVPTIGYYPQHYYGDEVYHSLCQVSNEITTIKKGFNSAHTTFDGFAGRTENGDELASGVNIH